MTIRPRFTFHLSSCLLPLALLAAMATLATPASTQAFSVLYDFTGGADGASPNGVTIAGPGILYGTTSQRGSYGWGTVFKLAQRGSGWTVDPLHEFGDGEDGAQPLASVAVGPSGALYGTTFQGGIENLGAVFQVQPPPTACNTAICYWHETLLHSFPQGGNDGEEPDLGILVFDPAGNLYGTTFNGGAYAAGTVFELSPSGGGWTYSIIHSFQNNHIDGWLPQYGVVLDSAGNLYGTTQYGGALDGGTAFELSPSGGTWTETILYNFPLGGDGLTASPTALVMDQNGNLYGTYLVEAANDFSTLFELTPSNGSWTFSTLYNFATLCGGPIVRDTAGRFYGACYSSTYGSVFQLANSNGSWTLTDLYDFTGQSDGGSPKVPFALDSSGNLYGGTAIGGNLSDCIEYESVGCGNIWEISGLADRH